MSTMKNKYIIRSRITEKKFRSILFYVSTSFTLVALQEVLILNPLKYQIRILIAKECEKTSKMQGEIEIDESYFLLRFPATANRIGYAKHKLSKFMGISKNNFILHLLHLKKTKFR